MPLKSNTLGDSVVESAPIVASFFERNTGLWAFLQAFGTPLTIIAAVWLALTQDQDRNLSTLIASRNIAQTSSRLIQYQIIQQSIDKHREVAKTELDALSDAWESVDFSNINPPFLAKSFIEIKHMHLRLYNHTHDEKQPSFDRPETIKRTIDAIERIDYYLDKQPCYKIGDDYNISSWIYRRLLDFRFWPRDDVKPEVR